MNISINKFKKAQQELLRVDLLKFIREDQLNINYLFHLISDDYSMIATKLIQFLKLTEQEYIEVLIMSMYYNNEEIILSLFDNNKYISVKNKILNSLIVESKTSLLFKILKKLSLLEINKLERNNLDFSIISLAIVHNSITNNNEDTIERLIQAGFNINKRDSNGDIPLTLAIVMENKFLIRLLLSNGANINNISTDGFTNVKIMLNKKILNKSLLVYLLNYEKYNIGIEQKETINLLNDLNLL
jgi:hypothetical protein